MRAHSALAASGLCALLALGCSSRAAPSSTESVPSSVGCGWTFAGNTPEDATRDSCVALTLERPNLSDQELDAGDGDAAADASSADAGADAGDSGDSGADPNAPYLSAHFASSTIGSFQASLALGPAPTPGTFSSATLSDWTVNLRTASGCDFSAGALSVPTGSFTLTLSELPSGDAGTLSGELDVTLYLHAASGMDCGPGDTERVLLRF